MKDHKHTRHTCALEADFALPSSTCPQNQGFLVGRLQKVRRGNADVPHENAVFGTKCWNAVQTWRPVTEKLWKVVPNGKTKSMSPPQVRFSPILPLHVPQSHRLPQVHHQKVLDSCSSETHNSRIVSSVELPKWCEHVRTVDRERKGSSRRVRVSR